MKNKEFKRKKRKQAPTNYLIVCEGKQTEPNYFNGLKQEINKKYGTKVDLLIPNIEIRGTGKNTKDLVNYTKKYVNHSNKIYGEIWVVFDKDDYNDKQFDEAIKNCEYNVAWSNPNFELWLLSHLKKIDRYISKENILYELEKEFNKQGLGHYKKNDEKIFEKITKNNKIQAAIKNCECMEKLNKKGLPHERNPMTTVYKIINGLTQYV